MTRARTTTSTARAAWGSLWMLLASCTGSEPSEPWMVTWSSSMAEVAPGFEDQTLRQVVRVSAGGEWVRVRLSHAFGTEPTRIGAASIGIAADGATIEPGTLRALTFDGSPTAELAPGAELRSDAVELTVPAGASLTVSLYLAAGSGDATRHRAALQTAYVASGNQVGAYELVPEATNASFHWVAGVDVDPREDALTVVAFGDSITEGSGSTSDLHNRYPDVLARELAARGVQASVANAGIGGNRLLNDGWGNLGLGPSGISRFERDALTQPGVTHILLLEGVNDLGMGGTIGPSVTAEEIIDGYEALIRRAHRHGVRVLIGTILPFRGASFPRYWTADNEAKRQAINAWIRATNRHDGFVDFDDVMRDPSDPERLAAALHSGDSLHPNDAGYQRMGEVAADVLAASRP